MTSGDEAGPAGADDVERAGGAVAAAWAATPDELVHAVEERDEAWVEQHGGPSGVATVLRSSATAGIGGDELRSAGGTSARAEFYGANKFRYPPPKSFFKLMLEAFKDYTIMILSFAAVVSLIIGVSMKEKRSHWGYLEGCAIVLVVLVVVLVQSGIDYQKEIKFRQLNSVKDSYKVQAVRAGEVIALVADDVLVGDVIKVSAGDKIAADGLLVEGSHLKTNESAMTGEVVDIAKSPDGDFFMLSGTTVSEGVGHMVVVAVGERSQWGTILSGLIVEPEDTPLQNRLDKLAMSIGRFGIIFASATFIVSMIHWGSDGIKRGRVQDGTKVLKFFIDAITIVVVAIPEGLPLAITLGLAFAMRKMMKDNNLVRRLEACETMGSATQLNADKTGTLTQNRMTVVEAEWGGADHVVYDTSGGAIDGGSAAAPAAAKTLADCADAKLLSDPFRALVAQSIAVNTQASLQRLATGRVEHLGSKTECALLQLVEDWGFSYGELRASSPPSRIYLFDSTKKRMSSTVDLPDGVTTRLFTKGAPEMVVELCSTQLDVDGVTLKRLDAAGRGAIVRKVDGMAARGLRTLLLAYRDVPHPKADEAYWKEAPETELVYLGVVGIKDPIRPETKEAVRLLKGAGVMVRMVTGDNPLTARFIAQEAGILDDDGLVMTGPEFRRMTPDEMAAVAVKIQVLARSTPNDKLILVREHKKLGEVVSVTGDGTNDAPALKEADVGFALGIAGTEIAKEACDIVILDDNIQSMAKAVLWGRNVYESIRKFLQFQLVVNVVAVTLNFLSACAKRDLPLSAVPLLWVNMIMDSMGALALATEAPRPELMLRKPFGRRAPLINRAMYRNILGMAVYQLTVCLVLQYAGKWMFGIPDCEPFTDGRGEVGNCGNSTLRVNTIIFNVFVFMQVASEINSRRIPEFNVFAGLHKSVLFMIIIFITVAIQILLILVVGGSSVGISIGIGKLDWKGWVAAAVLGTAVLPWGALVRLWPLDWCVGPTDEDPVSMSKLEKLLHLPARKPPAFDRITDEELAIADGSVPAATKDVDVRGGVSDTAVAAGALGVAAAGPPAGQTFAGDDLKARQASAALPAKVRLRVFVHAVAFVNVVQRRALSRSPEGPVVFEEIVEEEVVDDSGD
jgi:P-type Ca2+ transporter type 2C